jgi:hypothetical protein
MTTLCSLGAGSAAIAGSAETVHPKERPKTNQRAAMVVDLSRNCDRTREAVVRLALEAKPQHDRFSLQAGYRQRRTEK